MMQDAHFKPSINSSPLIRHKKWSSIGARVRYEIMPHYCQSIIAARSIEPLQPYELLRRLPINEQLVFTPQQIASQLTIHQPINTIHIPAVTQLLTYLSWRAQWKSINPSHQRATSAPITSVKQHPGVALALFYIQDRNILRTIMRLRHGRAFTHDVRMRFPSSAINELATPSCPINSFCKHSPCTANSINDSAQHLLLDCPLHQQARADLLRIWSGHPFGKQILSTQTLTLSLLLGEAPVTHPKPIDAARKAQFRSWYRALSLFIATVYRQLPVDTHYPKPL